MVLKKPMECIFILDIGTTNIKLTLHDKTGIIKHLEKELNPIEYRMNGRVELDAWELRRKVLSLLKRMANFADENRWKPVALGITSSRSSVLPIDKDKLPLTPFLMWQDKRASNLCEQMGESNAFVYHQSGLPISPVFSAIKMRYLLECAGIEAHQCAKLIGIQDYLIYCLTGKFVTDYTFAGRTNLFNLSEFSWDKDLLELFGIKREQLCDIVSPGHICGSINKDVIDKTGLPQGVLVISAGGDQQCSAIGNGVITIGTMHCNVGTGAYLITITDKANLDENMRFFCNPGIIPGTYILEAGLQTGGGLVSIIIDWLFNDYPREERYHKVDEIIMKTCPNPNGPIVLPHLSGSGCPHWDPSDKGVLYDFSTETKREDIARAALESIALELVENFDVMQGELTQPEDKIHIAGGMTNMVCFNQIMADVFNVDLILLGDEQATARGAWMTTAVSIELFPNYRRAYTSSVEMVHSSIIPPKPKNVPIYNRLLEKRKRLYSLVHQMSLF